MSELRDRVAEAIDCSYFDADQAISLVLDEAIVEIKEYAKDRPPNVAFMKSVYGDLIRNIEALKEKE